MGFSIKCYQNYKIYNRNEFLTRFAPSNNELILLLNLVMNMLKPLMKERLIQKYSLDMGEVFFFENYLIIEVAEGICFNHEKATELSLLTNLHFGNRPFGYISHRINSYSLKPTDYMKIREVFPNLAVFVVVAYTTAQEISVKIERIFYHDKIKIFETLEMAVASVKKCLELETQEK